jgi:hypothetical protein
VGLLHVADDGDGKDDDDYDDDNDDDECIPLSA